MTLLAPAFLLGLLAIGVPLWLHRLSSENPNRQPFSSVMFLEPGEPRRVLAKNLQYLLLLALRIGILALLALAFARPALQGAAQTLLGESASLHVIVVDVSASMDYGQRWARAQDVAGDLIDDMESTDLGQLVAAGRLTRVLTEPSLDRASLRQGLNALEPELFRIDYGQVISAMDGVLRGVEMPVLRTWRHRRRSSFAYTTFPCRARRTGASMLYAGQRHRARLPSAFGASVLKRRREQSYLNSTATKSRVKVSWCLRAPVLKSALTISSSNPALIEFVRCSRPVMHWRSMIVEIWLSDARCRVPFCS